MNIVEMKRTVEASARFKTRITAVFYLVTILAGALVILDQGRLAVELIVAVCYIALIPIFYLLSTRKGRL